MYRGGYYGLVDVKEVTDEDSYARAHYDLLLVAEGMPGEP